MAGQTATGEVKAIANCLESIFFLRSSNLLLSGSLYLLSLLVSKELSSPASTLTSLYSTTLFLYPLY